MPIVPNRNPHSGWSDIKDAPRDGTVIEIRNDYGIAPWYLIARWQRDAWVYADGTKRGVTDGPHLSWRPYRGSIADYKDPTRGEQEGEDYWRRAIEQKYPGVFNFNRRRNR